MALLSYFETDAYIHSNFCREGRRGSMSLNVWFLVRLAVLLPGIGLAISVHHSQRCRIRCQIDCIEIDLHGPQMMHPPDLSCSLPSLALFFADSVIYNDFKCLINFWLCCTDTSSSKMDIAPKMNNVCSACHKPVCVMCIPLAHFPDAQQAHVMAIAPRPSLLLSLSSMQMIAPRVSLPYKQVCITLLFYLMLPSTQPSPLPPSCFRPYLELSHQLNPSPDAKGHHVHVDGMQRAVTKHAAQPCMNGRVEHEKGDVIRKPEHVHTLN